MKIGARRWIKGRLLEFRGVHKRSGNKRLSWWDVEAKKTVSTEFNPKYDNPPPKPPVSDRRLQKLAEANGLTIDQAREALE